MAKWCCPLDFEARAVARTGLDPNMLQHDNPTECPFTIKYYATGCPFDKNDAKGHYN